MARIRIGVVGCGLIAQMMHLPHLQELDDLYELVAVCDVSPAAVAFVGDRYGVSRRHADWRDLLEEPLDAVLIATAGSHAPIALAALRAGKHVLTEKPMCYTLREADQLVEVVGRSGLTFMVAYMKRYDPGYRYAQAALPALLDTLRYVQVTVFHPSERAQIAHHDIRRFRDVPADVLSRLRTEEDALVREAIGEYTPRERTAFAEALLSTLVHDVNAVRGLVGDPAEVVTTEFWADAESLVTLLRYGQGFRVLLTLQYLWDLADYREEIALYAPGARLRFCFPSPFFRNEPTPVVVSGMEGDAAWEKRVVASHREAFKEELRHFAECVQAGRRPITSVEDGRADILWLHRIWAARTEAARSELARG
ncbi:MAG TPA: Gfo/Idh/MocA family oxidoreductase [Methylomirabilota bacterium]|jgi:predicted dehydrogenase|nr:Gfo/Idh/MocA family oxidoreductase [Methylomirabilota bacterium]